MSTFLHDAKITQKYCGVKAPGSSLFDVDISHRELFTRNLPILITSNIKQKWVGNLHMVVYNLFHQISFKTAALFKALTTAHGMYGLTYKV